MELGSDSVGYGYEAANRRGKCVVDTFRGRRTQPGIHTDRKRVAGLFWWDQEGRQQVGGLGGGAEGIDRRIRVGISGGASRFVGLRRCVTADAIYVER